MATMPNAGARSGLAYQARVLRVVAGTQFKLR